MSPANVNNLLKKLEQTLASGSLDPDHVLLRRFLASRDQAAIQCIISRHGPMVYRVCRRVLREEMDAEDAFQATFLIFIRQAGSIRKLQSLASWLHGVAYQVALRIRSSSQRRQACEAQLADRAESVVGDDTSWKEVRAILDEELARLPDDLRGPIVLCYLEGLTQDEAAEQLGQAKRTLQRRLQRGRERLGIRLAQRGLPAVGMLTLFAESVIAVPPSLESSTLGLADAILAGKSLSSLSQKLSALTQEVIKNMFPNRLSPKWAIVLLFGLGLATVAIGSLFAEGQPPQDSSNLNTDVKKEKEKGKLPIDGIAWGETVDGLKAGISFRPGEEHSCREGGSATFVVYLRNEGNTPISISHNENVFDEFLPSVLDESGKKIKVYPGPMMLGRVSRVDRTLEAGETIRLGTAWFLVKPAYWSGTAIAPTLLAPRAMYKYMVSCAGFPLRHKGRDSDEMLWSTGSVELALAYDPPHSSFTLLDPSNKSTEGKAIELFNGRDLTGWKVKGEEKTPSPPGESPMWQACGVHLDETNPKRFIGGIVNTPGGKGNVIACFYPEKNDLYSEAKFGDCTIELEFIVAQGSKSSIYVMGEYEVLIRDSFAIKKLGPTDLGGVTNSQTYPASTLTPPATPVDNPSKKVGEWQKLTIEFRAPRFDGDKKTSNAKFISIKLNDQLIHQHLEATKTSPGGLTGKESSTGPLLFHCESGPVAFKNIKITPRPGHEVSIPAKENSKDEIKVTVCGVFKREDGAFYIDASGLGYFPRVWIHLSEDKVSHSMLDPLVGKNVIVNGWVWQGKRSYKEGLEVFFIRFDPPRKFEWSDVIKVIPEKGDEALKKFGLKAEVRGVLKFENPRVEGGGGYHVVLKSKKKNDPEVRVWLNYLDPTQQKIVKKLLDKQVVVSGELKEEMTKSGALPYQALYIHKSDIEEDPGAPNPKNMTPESESPDQGRESKEDSEELVRRAFNEAMATGTPIETRYAIARHFKDLHVKELSSLACKIYKLICEQTNVSQAEQEYQEHAFLDLSDEYIRNNEFSEAERYLRKQLSAYPTGPDAHFGRLLLGVCLMQIASVPPPTGLEATKAAALRDEALRLFRTIVEADAKQKERKLSEHEAWVRLQASIRILLIHLQTNSPNDILRESIDLVERCRGTVEELIVWSLVYHAFKQKKETVKALETRDKMKELFDRLPASAFTSTTGEYSREYWEKTWFGEGIQ